MSTSLQHQQGGEFGRRFPYILPIRRLSILLVVLADLVEIVLVELAHKTGEVAVLEMLGQDGLGEFLALDGRGVSSVQFGGIAQHNTTGALPRARQSYPRHHPSVR